MEIRYPLSRLHFGVKKLIYNLVYIYISTKSFIQNLKLLRLTRFSFKHDNCFHLKIKIKKYLFISITKLLKNALFAYYQKELKMYLVQKKWDQTECLYCNVSWIINILFIGRCLAKRIPHYCCFICMTQHGAHKYRASAPQYHAGLNVGLAECSYCNVSQVFIILHLFQVHGYVHHKADTTRAVLFV